MSLSALFSVRALWLATCAALIACVSQNAAASESISSHPTGAIFATTAGNGGLLVIKRSVVLGHNVSVAIYIDGKPAGTLRRNHNFEKLLTPGRHTLVASPNQSRGEWQGTLNVRAGETYTYTASYNVNKIVLTPASMSR